MDDTCRGWRRRRQRRRQASSDSKQPASHSHHTCTARRSQVRCQMEPSHHFEKRARHAPAGAGAIV